MNKKVVLAGIIAIPLFIGAYTFVPIAPTSNGAAVQASVQSFFTGITARLQELGAIFITFSGAVIDPTPYALPEPSAETGGITVSVSGASEPQGVPTGTPHVLVGSFLFDASQASEDVSFSSPSFLYTDNTQFDPYNCAIYSGPTEYMTRSITLFNRDWVHPAGNGEYTFTLTTPLIVLKGEKKEVEIRCRINLQATSGTGSFSWGLSEKNGRAVFEGVGLNSKQTIMPLVMPSKGNTKFFTS